MRLPLIIMLMALIIASTSLTATAKENDFIIVPGQRVGNIYLGDNIAQATTDLGPPDDICDEGLNYCYQYTGRNIVLYARKSDNGIVSIETSDPRYHTETGVGIGTSEEQITSIYRQPDEMINYGFIRQYYYRRDGVLFQVYDRRVRNIQIRFADW